MNIALPHLPVFRMLRLGWAGQSDILKSQGLELCDPKC